MGDPRGTNLVRLCDAGLQTFPNHTCLCDPTLAQQRLLTIQGIGGFMQGRLRGLMLRLRGMQDVLLLLRV